MDSLSDHSPSYMEATEAEGDELIVPEEELGEDADAIFEEEARRGAGGGGSPARTGSPAHVLPVEPVDYRRKRNYVVSTWEKERLKNYPALFVPESKSDIPTPTTPTPNNDNISQQSGMRRSWTLKKDQTSSLSGIERNYAMIRSSTVSVMEASDDNNDHNDHYRPLEQDGDSKKQSKSGGSKREGEGDGAGEGRMYGEEGVGTDDHHRTSPREKGEGSKRTGKPDEGGSIKKKERKSSLKRRKKEKEKEKEKEREKEKEIVTSGSKRTKKVVGGSGSKREENGGKKDAVVKGSKRGSDDATHNANNIYNTVTPLSNSSEMRKQAQLVRGRSQTDAVLKVQTGEGGVEDGGGSLRLAKGLAVEPSIGGSLREKKQSRDSYLFLAKAVKNHSVKGNKGVGEIYKELEFHKGDTIGILMEADKEGMFFGEIHQKQGWFPSSHVQKYI